MTISRTQLASLSLFLYSTSVCVASGIEGMAPVLILAASFVGLSYLLLAPRRASKMFTGWFWIPCLVFSAWAMASLAWSFEPQVERMVTLAQVVAIGLVSAQIIAITGSAAAVELGFYAGVMVTLLVSPGNAISEAERQGGLLGHANDLATVIAGAAAFAARRADKMMREEQIAWASAAVVVAVFFASAYLAFYSAGSRRAIMVVTLCSLYVCYQWLRSAKGALRKLVAFLGIAASVVFVGPALLESTFYFRVESLISYLSDGVLVREHSLAVRSGMAHEAIDLWRSSPLLGIGLDNFRVVGSYGTYSHNNYLELLCGLGAISLIAYYFPHLRAMKLAAGFISAKDRSIASEAQWLVFLGFVILLCDVSSVSYYDKLGWLLLSVLLGCAVLVTRQRASYRSE